MKKPRKDFTDGAVMPWVINPSRVVTYIRGQIPCDRVAVGVIRAQNPQIDEFFLTHGWSTSELRFWLSTGYKQDRMLKAAMRNGIKVATKARGEARSPLTRASQGMMLMLPESLTPQRWWWFLLARDDEPFSPFEQQLARIMLRCWQNDFSNTPETGMGRVLVGDDLRVVVADLNIQSRIVHDPTFMQRLLASVAPVIAQRWPNLADNTLRDVVVEIDRRNLWISLRRRRATTDKNATQWYIETRANQSHDLPAVGVLKDDRIARAVAHIHDHFVESPRLNQIARQVHISPFHFHRLFSRHVGLSPKHYLQAKQLQIARWTLSTTRLPISTIAQQSGYASHAHFTSTFQKVVGMSPRDYRESV